MKFFKDKTVRVYTEASAEALDKIIRKASETLDSSLTVNKDSWSSCSNYALEGNDDSLRWCVKICVCDCDSWRVAEIQAVGGAFLSEHDLKTGRVMSAKVTGIFAGMLKNTETKIRRGKFMAGVMEEDGRGIREIHERGTTADIDCIKAAVEDTAEKLGAELQPLDTQGGKSDHAVCLCGTVEDLDLPLTARIMYGRKRKWRIDVNVHDNRVCREMLFTVCAGLHYSGDIGEEVCAELMWRLENELEEEKT